MSQQTKMYPACGAGLVRNPLLARKPTFAGPKVSGQQSASVQVEFYRLVSTTIMTSIRWDMTLLNMAI